MSSPATSNEDFPDMKTHQQMWTGYTHLITRGIVGVVILLLFIGYVTGVL